MKAQGLSLSTIVIAAVVLLVLVVLSVVFAARMGLWNEGLKHCDTVCKASSDECTTEGYSIPVYVSNCQDNLGNTFDGPAYCCKEKTS
jgi:hypothetical protein